MADKENSPLTTVAFKSFEAKYAAAQEGNAGYQRKSLRWSVLTFCAVAAYTIVTLFVLLFSGLAWQTEKDNLYYSQRASVILTDVLPVPVLVGTNIIGGYIVIPQWTNVGNTNATEMNYRNNFQFSHDDLPGGFTAFQGGPKIEGPASLGPKQALNAGAFRNENGDPLYFPETCFAQVAQGKYKYVYMWGWAKYTDILRPEVKRETRYCWRIYGTMKVSNNPAFNHYLCDEGNCQDEACKVYERMSGPKKLPDFELCPPVVIPDEAKIAPVPPAGEQSPK
jgi:hypothetical protein